MMTDHMRLISFVSISQRTLNRNRPFKVYICKFEPVPALTLGTSIFYGIDQ